MLVICSYKFLSLLTKSDYTYLNSDPEVECGDEVRGLCDDVLELAGGQLLVVVNVGLKQNLKREEEKNEKTKTLLIFICSVLQCVSLCSPSFVIYLIMK